MKYKPCVRKNHVSGRISGYGTDWFCFSIGIKSSSLIITMIYACDRFCSVVLSKISKKQVNWVFTY